jgi:hypothetical protein
MDKYLVLFVVIVLIVLGIIFLINNLDYFIKDPFTLYYAGGERHFRANLAEANKTIVYPNENSIRDVLFNPEVYKIKIAFIPNDTENAFYLASSFEITNKLGIIFKHFSAGQTGSFKEDDGSSCIMFYEEKQNKCFKSFPINSTDELVPTSIEPVILLLGPSYANQTAVTVKDNMIVLEGKDFSEIDRKYTDLDLATDKMLLVLMSDYQQAL